MGPVSCSKTWQIPLSPKKYNGKWAVNFTLLTKGPLKTRMIHMLIKIVIQLDHGTSVLLQSWHFSLSRSLQPWLLLGNQCLLLLRLVWWAVLTEHTISFVCSGFYALGQKRRWQWLLQTEAILHTASLLSHNSQLRLPTLVIIIIIINADMIFVTSSTSSASVKCFWIWR